MTPSLKFKFRDRSLSCEDKKRCRFHKRQRFSLQIVETLAPKFIPGFNVKVVSNGIRTFVRLRLGD